MHILVLNVYKVYMHKHMHILMYELTYVYMHVYSICNICILYIISRRYQYPPDFQITCFGGHLGLLVENYEFMNH